MPSNAKYEMHFTYAQRLWVLVSIALVPLAIAMFFQDKKIEKQMPPDGKAPVIEEVHVTRSTDSRDQKITLPYVVDGQPDEIMDFRISLTLAAGQSTLFWVVPDDCVQGLTVNHVDVTLSDEAKEHHCDWKDGFRVDLASYLKEGSNDITLKIQNKNGLMGLSFVSITK